MPGPPDNADLLFWQPTPDTADLLFGATPDGGTETATLAIGLPPLGVAVAVAQVTDAAIAIGLPPLGVAVATEWDPQVQRVLASRTRALHQQAVTAGNRATVHQHQQAATANHGVTASHQPGKPASHGVTATHQQSAPLRHSTRATHQQAAPVRRHTAVQHADAIRTRAHIAGRHQQAAPVRHHTATPHADAIRLRHARQHRQQQGAPVRRAYIIPYAPGVPIARELVARHQDAMRPPPGRYAPPPAPPPPVPYIPPDLLFCQPRTDSADLLFGWLCGAEPGGTIIIPIRSVYIVLNTVTLVRASDGAPLSAISINLSVDADSWTWGFDTTLSGTDLPLLDPLLDGEPVELLATINGQGFRVLAERVSRDRTFGNSRLRVTGRGRSAMLASPHSPVVTRSNAFERTAQQLAIDALTDNGVSLGWSLDWQATDWLVPAGVYSHTGSYIEHVRRVAEAAGAYVQPDPLLDTLHVLPRYPSAPWEWGTAPADIELPSAPVVREAIEWQRKPAYNRVFVSGTELGGIVGQVTRAGTAGDIVAPMVTDALITHVDAARARGMAILADTGSQAQITLDLPVLPETGIIVPGKLIHYTDGGLARRGLVRGTTVRAQLPTVRQSIVLETHA